MGEVVDPEPLGGSVPRTVSMTWTDPCDVEVSTALALVVSCGYSCVCTSTLFPGVGNVLTGCDMNGTVGGCHKGDEDSKPGGRADRIFSCFPDR